MPSLSVARKENAAAAPTLPDRTVAVVLGGTAGIGRGACQVWARYAAAAGKRLHIVIIGRNKAAADDIIGAFPSGVTGDFVACDAVYMRNVRAAVKLVYELPGVDKINWLLLTAGTPSVKKQERTDEGLLPWNAPTLYARQRFAPDLAPLLQRAADAGEPSRVLIISGYTNIGSPFDLEALKKADPSVNLRALPALLCTVYDSFATEFTRQHPDIAFAVQFPGGVRTGWTRELPLWFRGIWTVLNPFLAWSMDECGEFLYHSMTQSQYAKGPWTFKERGDVDGRSPYATPEAAAQLWEYLDLMTREKA